MKKEYQKIKIPGIVYGSHVATTVWAILAETLVSERNTTNEKIVLTSFYFPYFLIPVLFALSLSCIDSKVKKVKPFEQIGGTSNKGFMDLLKKNDLEEYEDLFVIKAKDRDNHRDGKHLQVNSVGNNSSPKVIYNNTVQTQPQKFNNKKKV